MIGALSATGCYFLIGTVILISDRYKFQLSFLGWMIAAGSLTSTALKFFQTGPIIWHLSGWYPLGIEMKVDLPAIFYSGLVVTLNLATLLYLDKDEHKIFFSLFNYLFATAIAIELAHDLFNLYVTIELLSLISILLIGYQRKTFQIWAGIKYLFLSSLSMSLYLIGTAILYWSSGSLSIQQLANIFDENKASPAISLALALMVVGLAVKGGVFFFSMWLPDAHSYSSTVVSALLSGMAIKGGMFGILRLSEIANLHFVLTVIGGVTGLVGAIYAVMENRPKKILAFHTMSQMGYVLIGMGAGTILGMLGAALHLVFHGVFKALLFLSVGAIDTKGKSVYQLKNTAVPRGAKIGLLIGSLSIMTVPPFNGFFSKSLCFETTHSIWLTTVLLAIGLGTVISFIKLNHYFLSGDSLPFSYKTVSIALLSLITIVSGIIAIHFLPQVSFRQLLNPLYTGESFALLGLGGIIYLLFQKKIKAHQLSPSIFNLDNSLIAIFTGLFFVLGLIVLG